MDMIASNHPTMKRQTKLKKIYFILVLIGGAITLLHLYPSFTNYTNHYTPEFKKRKKSGLQTDQNEIFFLRTSDEDFQHFELCALYAAGKSNPNKIVSWYSQRSFELPKCFQDVKNVKTQMLNFSHVFNLTPLEKWYKSKIWNSLTRKLSVIKQWQQHHTVSDAIIFAYLFKYNGNVQQYRVVSDALRVAYLYKYGGIYLDSDIITLKDIPFRNALAYQYYDSFANGFIALEKGHPLLNMILEYEAANYDPMKLETEYGPDLLTKMYNEYSRNPDPTRNSIETLETEVVFPFSYDKTELLLKPVGKGGEWESALDKAFTVHIGRNRLMNVLRLGKIVPPKGSILYAIANKHCKPVLNRWKITT